MKNLIFRTSVTIVFVCLFSLTANAQIKKIPMKTLELSKDAAVFVVGKTAKLAARTAIKTSPVMLKATEKAGLFLLEQSKNLLVKAVLPASRKLIVKYLKYRLMP